MQNLIQLSLMIASLALAFLTPVSFAQSSAHPADSSHRVESIMHKVYERAQGDANLWEHFTRFDKNAPGLAEVGTVHYAPNSLKVWGQQGTSFPRPSMISLE